MKTRTSILIALFSAIAATFVVNQASSLDVYGELKAALFEKLAADPANTEARAYYNTTDDVVKVRTGAAWVELLDNTSPDITGAYNIDGNIFLDNKGTRNTWVGDVENTAHTTGVDTTAVGYQACLSLRAGNTNNCVGSGAGRNIRDGVANSILGYEALRSCVDCSSNMAIGLESLYNQNLNDGTAVGRGAGYNTNAAGPTFIGRTAGAWNTTGTYSVAIGFEAMTDVTTGEGNTFLGSNTTGTTDTDFSIALGKGATVTSDNTMGVGSSAAPVTSYFLGEGESSTSPSDVQVEPTKASGADVAGGDLILAGGRATGSAASGSVRLQTAPAGASSSTLQTLEDAFEVDTLAATLFDQRALQFREDAGSGANYAAIQAPATLGGDYTLTLPDNDGDAGDVLSSNGSGTLSWVATLTNPYSVAPSTTSVSITGSADGETSLAITSADAGSLINLRSVDDTVATPALVDSGDTLGSIRFTGYDGNTYEQGARIQAVVDTTSGDGDMPGRLEFLTTPNASASPSEALELNSSQQAIFGGGSTGDALIQASEGSTGSPTYSFVGDDSHGLDRKSDGDGIALVTSGTERLRIGDTGTLTITAGGVHTNAGGWSLGSVIYRGTGTASSISGGGNSATLFTLGSNSAYTVWVGEEGTNPPGAATTCFIFTGSSAGSARINEVEHANSLSCSHDGGTGIRITNNTGGALTVRWSYLSHY